MGIKQLNAPTPKSTRESLSVVDMIIKLYESGAFKLMNPGRHNMVSWDLYGLDRDRLVRYFLKRSEFNHEAHNEKYGDEWVTSDEFISDLFDIEIHDHTIYIYKISQTESLNSDESNKIEEGSKMSKYDKLAKKLHDVVHGIMMSPEFGFDDKEADEYSAVEVKDDGDRVRVEVRAEVGYDDMWTIMDACNPIVQKYDPEAYFDAEQPGIATAYIDKITESVEVPGPITAENNQVALSEIINDLIVDEYEAIKGYTSAIAAMRAEGYENVAKVLEDISEEESIHVGQLQEAMKLFDPGAVKVDEGHDEAIEQLSDTEESADESDVEELVLALDDEPEELVLNIDEESLTEALSDKAKSAEIFLANEYVNTPRTEAEFRDYAFDYMTNKGISPEEQYAVYVNATASDDKMFDILDKSELDRDADKSAKK